MSAQSRRRRGSESQTILAAFLRDHGWPYAEPTGAGRQGSDVRGTPLLDWEVKARRNLDITGTLRQLNDRATSGIVPIAVLRPDGYGPSRIAEWPAITPLHVLVHLLRSAGYGDPAP